MTSLTNPGSQAVCLLAAVVAAHAGKVKVKKMIEEREERQVQQALLDVREKLGSNISWTFIGDIEGLAGEIKKTIKKGTKLECSVKAAVEQMRLPLEGEWSSGSEGLEGVDSLDVWHNAVRSLASVALSMEGQKKELHKELAQIEADCRYQAGVLAEVENHLSLARVAYRASIKKPHWTLGLFFPPSTPEHVTEAVTAMLESQVVAVATRDRVRRDVEQLHHKVKFLTKKGAAWITDSMAKWRRLDDGRTPEEDEEEWEKVKEKDADKKQDAPQSVQHVQTVQPVQEPQKAQKAQQAQPPAAREEKKAPEVVVVPTMSLETHSGGSEAEQCNQEASSSSGSRPQSGNDKSKTTSNNNNEDSNEHDSKDDSESKHQQKKDEEDEQLVSHDQEFADMAIVQSEASQPEASVKEGSAQQNTTDAAGAEAEAEADEDDWDKAEMVEEAAPAASCPPKVEVPPTAATAIAAAAEEAPKPKPKSVKTYLGRIWLMKLHEIVRDGLFRISTGADLPTDDSFKECWLLEKTCTRLLSGSLTINNLVEEDCAVLRKDFAMMSLKELVTIRMRNYQVVPEGVSSEMMTENGLAQEALFVALDRLLFTKLGAWALRSLDLNVEEDPASFRRYGTEFAGLWYMDAAARNYPGGNSSKRWFAWALEGHNRTVYINVETQEVLTEYPRGSSVYLATDLSMAAEDQTMHVVWSICKASKEHEVDATPFKECPDLDFPLSGKPIRTPEDLPKAPANMESDVEGDWSLVSKAEAKEMPWQMEVARPGRPSAFGLLASKTFDFLKRAYKNPGITRSQICDQLTLANVTNRVGSTLSTVAVGALRAGGASMGLTTRRFLPSVSVTSPSWITAAQLPGASRWTLEE